MVASTNRHLTLVSDHDGGTIVWGKPGKDTATLIEAVSMDMGLAYAKVARERAPTAVICVDPFHVVKLAADALEAVRSQVWQAAARCPICASPKPSRARAGPC